MQEGARGFSEGHRLECSSRSSVVSKPKVIKADLWRQCAILILKLLRRAKMKKVQRKSKDGGDKSDKDKEDKIKQESPSSDYIVDNGYGQPLNPNLPFSPDGNLFKNLSLNLFNLTI